MVASIPDREMSLRANVTVVSWANAVSLRKELHQRELTAVAEEIASSVGRAALSPTNLRGLVVSFERSKVNARVRGIVFVCVVLDRCGGAEPHVKLSPLRKLYVQSRHLGFGVIKHWSITTLK